MLEDRHGRRSNIATGQLPMEQWHSVVGDTTLTDAILDRLVHNAYKINLRGESMRKRQAKMKVSMTSDLENTRCRRIGSLSSLDVRINILSEA